MRAVSHSAPARVLPKPRPALMTQVDHSPAGASWPAWAQASHARSRPVAQLLAEHAERGAAPRGRERFEVGDRVGVAREQALRRR
jgi:hypothetical protein